MQYDVFIAHPSERKADARACAEALRLRGLRPFVDEQIAPGAAWGEALRRAQEGCRATVVLWYPGLQAGPYLRDEIDTALQRHRQFQHIVWPVWLGSMQGRPPYGLGSFQATVVGEDWSDFATEVGRQLEDPVYAREKEIEGLEGLEAQLAEQREAGGETTAIAARLRELRRKRRVEEVPARLGSWEIIEPIGKGGFATVYLARLAGPPGRIRRAIKVLHSDRATHGESVERFCAGSRTMLELEHPGIVRVHEPATAGMKDQHGHVFFVMDHVDGGDLQRRVLAGLSVEDGVRLVLQAAEALDHAHGLGRVHRDVKPANILVGRDGRALVTDFDLVLAEESTHGTRTGAALGTVLYAAPEQLESAGTVDRRADVYGLGMVLAFVLAGGKVNARDAMYRREKFLAGLPCPDALREVVRRATEPEEDERTGEIRGLIAELEAAARGVSPGRVVGGPGTVGTVVSSGPLGPEDLVAALLRAADAGRWGEVQECARLLSGLADSSWSMARAEGGRPAGELMREVQELVSAEDGGKEVWLARLALGALLERSGRAADVPKVWRAGETVVEPVGLPFVYIPGGPSRWDGQRNRKSSAWTRRSPGATSCRSTRSRCRRSPCRSPR